MCAEIKELCVIAKNINNWDSMRWRRVRAVDGGVLFEVKYNIIVTGDAANLDFRLELLRFGRNNPSSRDCWEGQDVDMEFEEHIEDNAHSYLTG